LITILSLNVVALTQAKPLPDGIDYHRFLQNKDVIAKWISTKAGTITKENGS
jgi:hypothetical protein